MKAFMDNMVGVLVKQTVKLKRPVYVGENLTITTRAKGERKIQFLELMI